MNDSHEHHGHQHGASAPPEEPGYPSHPEVADAHRAAAELATHAGHGPHAGPGEHAAHDRGHAAHGGEHAAHDKHAGHSVVMFRNKFWVTLLLTLPTLVWGEMIPGLLGFA